MFAWFTLFREHTNAHAFFMVRGTIVWIAAGWCWLIAQRTGLGTPVPQQRSAVPAFLGRRRHV
jgi:hypothetical protein